MTQTPSSPFAVFRNSTVLLTGHTGFKGSWLAAWLHKLGARVVGIALDPPTTPSHHDALGTPFARELRFDIRDRKKLAAAFTDTRPDFVFHLAAQPLVRPSYADPATTYETNVIGTLNVLEALRQLTSPCAAVLITSDKCYDNVEWIWGYKETDRLGGADPYSASKGAAELLIRSHVASFFSAPDANVSLAVGRAGNVIGGGDWAADRIVPDCVRSWSRGETVSLRNPHATRPWQHVLEPLSGYLALACALRQKSVRTGEPFNFGPADTPRTVLELVEAMERHWSKVRWTIAAHDAAAPHEAGLLRLNCDKALHALRWEPTLDFIDTVRMTAEWYRAFYEDHETVSNVTHAQIDDFSRRAKASGRPWAQ